MARRPRDSRIETREARLRLLVRGGPYWRRVQAGVFVGYRRLPGVAGTWSARFRVGERYCETRLGVADDFADSGGRVLSYSQAVAATMKAATELADPEQRARGPYTVAQCMADYLEHYTAEGKALAATRTAVEAHILPALGERLVGALTAEELRRWHRGLASAAPRIRRGLGAARRVRTLDPEATPAEAADWTRSRQATANRVLTYLRAALNHAFREGRVTSDAAWRKVRPFKGADAPRIRFLTIAEAQRLLNACAPDFRDLVHGALMTGCRYGELSRMLCSDFNADAGTVLVRQAKGGKPRHVPLTLAEGAALFTRLAAGRKGSAPLFLHNGREWRKSEQARPLAEACRVAGLESALSFHGLRHTYAATLAQAGVQLQVIAAALGHTDTRLTERWYAHLLPSYIADTVRANLPAFTQEHSNVRPMTPARSGKTGVESERQRETPHEPTRFAPPPD